MNKYQLQQLRKQLRGWVLGFEPNYFLTFNFGYTASDLSAEKAIKNFFNRIQRKGLGRSWYKLPATLRPVAFGFLEHESTNAHYHVLARVCPKIETVIKAEGEAIWKGLVTRGQFHWERVHELHGALSYATKRLTKESAFGSIFIYSTSVK